MSDYQTSLPCSRAEADAAMLADDLFPSTQPAPVLVASETAEGWALQLFTAAPPDAAMLARLRALAPSAGPPTTMRLAETDWVTLSQAGLEPVDIGRFHIHTGDHVGKARAGQWPIRIDAGLAFGTGQHATTAGCIRAAARLARARRATNILDIGTGSGLLAFVAQRLHRRAQLTAADLDAVAVTVARGNARRNAVLPGFRPGALLLLVAPGVIHRQIAVRAPYDLLFANILAGPLVALAPSIATVVKPGGRLILAGLLQQQAQQVLATYRNLGFFCEVRDRRAEWPVLVLKRRRPADRRSAIRGARRETAGRRWRADSI